MRIVVTGLSGNVGTALLRRLAADPPHGGPLDVVGVCRRPPRSGEPYQLAEWAALDLADGGAASRLRPVVAGADAVVHLAWLFQPAHNAGYLERTAIGGTSAVLEACVAEGVGHLVHLSSLGVYSPGPAEAGRRVDESWPRDGVATLAYSRHKAAAERLLDAAPPGGPRIARLRPGLVLQQQAGSALLRYGLPPWVPAAAVGHLPVLPLDRGLVVQAVHADDVADAVAAVLERGATGAFNLAAEPPITRDDLAAALGARPVHLPGAVLRGLAAATWRAWLQPLDPGWLDLALAVPLMDSSRARDELGWSPSRDALSALRDAVTGMTSATSAPSPALRPRTVAAALRDTLRRGPIEHRALP